MALVLNDRVRETTTIVGTGTATLLGAAAGYQSFSVIGNANTCYYTISDQAGTNWEVGIGTYVSATPALARTTVLKSSNAGALVSFTAGTKDVFVTYPAETAVSGGGGGTYPTTQPSLNLDFANTRQLDPRITFVRNSIAAYYDGQTTAMAEQNLLKYSQDFAVGASIWYPNEVTLTGGQTAPDGTSTANKLIATVTGSAVAHNIYYRSNQIVVDIGKIYTASFYTKAAEYSIFNMQDFYGGMGNAYFDLNGNSGAGSVLSVSGSSATASITLVGSGWYRCTVSYTQTTYTTVSWSCVGVPVSGTISYLGDGTSGIYIWGAQLEQRSSATAYTPTTTAAITNYIPVLLSAPAGVARFDCDPITGKSLGLLIEEIRVNSLDFSSSFATSGGVQNNWADTNITRTAAAFIAPDSTQVGIQFTASAANATVISTAAVGSSLARTFSVWLKRISGTGVINYTLDNGTTWIAQAITSTVTRYIFTTTTANQQVGFQIVTSGDSIGIWGAQLEAGSFATSYIPTVASTVTRAADQASMTGTNFSSWYNQSQGSFVITAIPFSTGMNSRLLSTQNSTIEIIGYSGTQAQMYDGAALNAVGIFTNGIQNKIAAIYTATQKGISCNGSAITTAATSAIPSAFTQATSLLLLPTAASNYSDGWVQKLTYYPIALSSSNLVALTS